MPQTGAIRESEREGNKGCGREGERVEAGEREGVEREKGREGVTVRE